MENTVHFIIPANNSGARNANEEMSVTPSAEKPHIQSLCEHYPKEVKVGCYVDNSIR